MEGHPVPTSIRDCCDIDTDAQGGGLDASAPPHANQAFDGLTVMIREEARKRCVSERSSLVTSRPFVVAAEVAEETAEPGKQAGGGGRTGARRIPPRAIL